MAEIDWEKFEWVADHAVVMFSLTFVEGLAPEAVLGMLGADMAPEALDPEQLVLAAGPDRRGVRVAPIGAWSVLIELDSLMGGRDQVLRPLSSDGRRVFNTLATGSGMKSVSYWCDGQQLCQLDPIMPEHRVGTQPDALVEHMTAVGMGPELPEDQIPPSGAMVALAERVTGVAADRGLVLNARWPAGFVDQYYARTGRTARRG